MKQDIPSTANIPSKITRVSVVDQVCSAIKQNIVDGIWQEGDKLPSEAQLAEMFGVNRLSTRMALGKLSALGFIETRVGDGSYVQVYSLRPILDEISVLYQSEEKGHEVQQLRNLLEGECIRLAVLQSSEEDLKSLEDCLSNYDDVVHGAYAENIDNKRLLDAVVDADFAFHYQIVRMSHNSLYKDIYYMVQQLIRNHITELLDRRNHRRRELGLSYISDSHFQIFEGIKEQDLEKALAASRRVLGVTLTPLDEAAANK